ncbi:MAG: RNA methyltransferase [Corallococcus sp.]|nr:RNA methyltransferase [Corallococcus sp.]
MYMLITSTSNAQIVLLKKLLSDNKYRDREHLYCIEGERLVCEAIKFGKQIKDVYVKESVRDKFELPHNIDVTYISDRVFDFISQTVNGQGIIATIVKEDAEICAPKGNCLILDGVRDPGNLGTLLRTAAATGFDDVYLCNCVDVYSPKVIRSAMSAHFAIRVFSDSIERVFNFVQKRCRILCCDMGGNDPVEYKSQDNIALVLGNEANGLCEYSRKNCNGFVGLQMKNNIESLNVAVAGSVLMYILNS